ncbi:HD domain-containing phosphohydrolase [Baekduia sp.]|jgi:putative nucleotidyltransferase with HDIG domain|uniref:HD domain-containing phosphohydrolase n=1 Tax=Baekduia sp. TaxID=2600305 RepID=UPI002E068A52|nr:HD domain-containing phosphohydrolase [Baekduia sp.]
MGIVIRRPAQAVREVPMVLAATAAVTVLPALLATWMLPARHAPALILSTVVAMALAAVITRLGAAAWSRKPGAQDLLFADLMLWSWLRRRWTERRLATAQRQILARDAQTTAMPLGALTRMGRLLEARDMYTYGHSRRVARHAATIARAMRLDAETVKCVRRAALVHDVGKIYTPREILDKPGRLTDAEFAIIKRHANDGADLLGHLGEPEVVAIVRHHHERLDGGGYPAGLAGTKIPLGARIIAVADTFDALTSTRSYRRSTSHKQALAILTAEAGTQLDADAVAAFVRHYSASRPAALAAAATSGGERLLGWLGGASAGLSSGAGALGAAASAAAVLALGPALAPISSRAVPERAATPAITAALPAVPAGPAKHRAATRAPATSKPTTRRKPAARGDGEPTPRPSRAPAPHHAPATANEPSAEPAGSTTHTGGTVAIGAPEAGLPAVTTPAVSTPVATVAPVRVPATPAAGPPAQIRLPEVTVPAITTPVATIPAVTVAATEIAVPTVSLPTVPHG